MKNAIRLSIEAITREGNSETTFLGGVSLCGKSLKEANESIHGIEGALFELISSEIRELGTFSGEIDREDGSISNIVLKDEGRETEIEVSCEYFEDDGIYKDNDEHLFQLIWGIKFTEHNTDLPAVQMLEKDLSPFESYSQEEKELCEYYEKNLDDLIFICTEDDIQATLI